MKQKSLFKIFVLVAACALQGALSAEELPPSSYVLSLDEVSHLALENNFDIQLAKFDAQIKQTDLDKEKSIFDTVIDAEIKYKDNQLKTSSTLAGTKSLNNQYNLGIKKKLPTGTTVDLDFTNDRTWTNSSFSSVNPSHESAGKIGITQELGKNFFGLNDRGKIKITRLDIENASYTSLDLIESSLASAQKSYFRLVLALESHEIRASMLEQAQELYGLHKSKVKDGLVETPALLASEANLRQRESDILLAENDLQYSMNQLKFVLNLNENVPDIIPSDAFDAVSKNAEIEQTLSKAFAARRDYKSAKNTADSKKIQLVMKKNNLWPEINLEATFTKNGIDDHFSGAIDSITTEDNPELYVGLKISFPLENRLAKSEYSKADLEKAKSIVSLKRVERLIITDLVDKVRNCNIYYDRLAKQRTIAQIQENKLEAEEKRFKYGRSDTDTIIRYQDDLLSAKLLARQAAYDYQLALIDLAVAENTLLDNYFKEEI